MKKRLIAILLLALSAFVMPVVNVSAAEVGNDPACSSDKLTDKEALAAAGCPTGEEDAKIGDVAKNIINVVITVLGLVAVLFVVIGGVNYTTSQGDPQKTKKARDTILYAILGVILAVLAYTIVNFVISGITGSGSGSGETSETSDASGSAGAAGQ